MKDEVKKEEKPTKEEVKVEVVAQLPTNPIRQVEAEGIKYELLTTNEALTEILEKVRRIDKAL